MNTKTIGVLIIFLGIFVMIATAASVFMVFTGRSAPIQLFHLPPLRINPSSFIPSLPTLPGGFKIPTGSSDATLIDLYPADAINSIANTSAHLFLAGFFVNVGFKLASLGVQLVAASKGEEERKRENTLPVALRPNPPV